MGFWKIALLSVAAYVAVMTLVRLMIRRRDQLLRDFRGQMEAEKERKKKAEKKTYASGRPTRPS